MRWQSLVDVTAVRISQIKTVRDIGTRFRENWKGFVREYWAFLLLALLASLADTASTIHFMLHTGPQVELHPTVRWLSELLGPVLGPLLGKGVQFGVLIALTVFLRRRAVLIFIPIIILYTWAAWYNIWGYHLYYPRLLHWLEFLAI
jgi:hypothetical protein